MNIKEIITKFYPIVSGVLKQNDFEEIYKHATTEKFGFLTIITHNGLRGKISIRKNWNVNLTIK